MKHIFVVNPKAGKGDSAQKYSKYVENRAGELGLDYEIHITGAPRDGLEFVRQRAASDEHIRFYACGGDGTLYEVVNGAAGRENAEVAAVPLGSGNDFVRLFGKKEDLLDIGVHINGTPSALDLIKCGKHYAINQCSMGFDAEVCAKQADFKRLKPISAKGAYSAALISCVLNKLSHDFTIAIDGGEPFTMSVLFCYIGNSRWYGGGFMAGPKAIPDDGLLDFVILKGGIPRRRLLPLAAVYKKGEHLSLDITTYIRGKKITVTSETPAAVNIDGETEHVREMNVEIVEKGIKFVVPSNSDYFERKKNGTL